MPKASQLLVIYKLSSSSLHNPQGPAEFLVVPAKSKEMINIEIKLVDMVVKEIIT